MFLTLISSSLPFPSLPFPFLSFTTLLFPFFHIGRLAFVLIHSLEPGALYYYRCGGTYGPSWNSHMAWMREVRTFRAPPPSSPPFHASSSPSSSLSHEGKGEGEGEGEG